MGSMAGTLTAEPETSSEGVLAEMLAGVMKIEEVPFDSHFFDDLGADSLVMAKFCARVRKREGLPVMSMQDIYANPTIRSLAEAFGIAEAEAEVQVDLDAIPTLIQPRDPILARSAAPTQASTRQHLTCGRQHRRRQSCKTCHFNSIRLRRTPAFQPVQKHHFAFAFSRSDLIVLRARQAFCEFSEFVIVRGEECLGCVIC